MATHFVGFRDDRYWNAVKVWGLPDFIHPSWDRHAIEDISPRDDLVIFAEGDEKQPLKRHNWRYEL